MPSGKKQRASKKTARNAGAGLGKPGRTISPSIAAAGARLDAANAVEDLESGLHPFLSMDLPSVALRTRGEAGKVSVDPPVSTRGVRLKIRSYTTLAPGEAPAMYRLLKDNMHDLYVEAGWGWNEAEKWREMEHRHARFLIAQLHAGGDDDEDAGIEGERAEAKISASLPTDGHAIADGVRQESEPEASLCEAMHTDGHTIEGIRDTKGSASVDKSPLAGYCHFRFAWDEDENDDGEGKGGTQDVLYVYELQVASWAKRRGLGRRMMQALELLANRHAMSKVMLTVFKENKEALSFYTKKMKYGIDDESPSKWNQPDAVYEILSKPTRHGTGRAQEAGRTRTLFD